VDVDGSKTEYLVRFLDAEGYDYAVLRDETHADFLLSRLEVFRRHWRGDGVFYAFVRQQILISSVGRME
jgi:hypothetical protein